MAETNTDKLAALQLQEALRHGGIDELARLKAISAQDREAAALATDRIAKEDAKAMATSGFEEFLRAEYNNIAQAHFQTHTSITRFLQFYLIVAGLPITIAGVLFRFAGDSLSNPSPPAANSPAQAVSAHARILQIVNSECGWFLLLLAGTIAVVGICMMAYVVNLRLDALLYARVVNGIRKYFFDRVRLGVREEATIRALPRSIHQPRYREWPFFGWVVVAFACLNSLYVVVVYIIVAMWLALV